MYDLIILGGGPAGLTAAVYSIRKRLDVLLISPDLGGKTGMHMHLPDSLERFQVITGDEVVSRFKSQIEYLEFARKLEHGEKVDAIQGGYAVTTQEGHQYEAKALIVATGARPVKLNVPGESKYRFRGLAYSAVSYAPLFIDRAAAVVGEGELGLKSALELAQIARQVYLILPAASLLDNPMGKKLRASIELRHIPYKGWSDSVMSVDGIKSALRDTVSTIMGIYRGHEFYTLTLLFTSIAEKKATIEVEQILPPDPDSLIAHSSTGRPFTYLEAEMILKRALEEFLSISLYRCYVESLRSENWYRLRSMEGASDTIRKYIGELSSSQKYIRQEEITEEMLEILGSGLFYR